MDGRIVVHQAIGMAMEYLDCSALEALAELAMLARSTGKSLGVLANDVIERRVRLPASST